MSVLVFGGSGMLGHKLVQRLGGRFDVWSTIREPFSALDRFGVLESGRTIDNVDVTRLDQVRAAIEKAQPAVVINAVGLIKQVPAASEAADLLAVNSVFPRQLASLATQYQFRLITISTDCVFSGDRGMYTEVDFSDARDLYGISKFLGEATDGNCLTLRTSIIGRELGTKHSIVEWFLTNRGAEVNGYTKAIYTGFPTLVFSEIVADIIDDHTDLRGLYHISSSPITKFDLLTLLNKEFAASAHIRPFDEYVIDRSLDSSRFRAATGFVPDSWENMIAAMAADQTPYDTWARSSTA